MKTIEYSQPSFYHFSRDSIELSIVASKIYPNIKSICDFYAGSGVVGIEFSFRVDPLDEIVFVENNLSYKVHLERNINQLKDGYRTNIYWDSSLPCDLKKDTLILANPPYFIKNDGRLPQDLDKRNCHFIEEAQWQNWLHQIRDFPHLFLARLDLPHIRELKYELHKALDAKVGVISLK